MEISDYPSWPWGLSLIALTLAFHATAVVMMGIVTVKIRLRLETGGFYLWHLIPIMICMVTVIGLVLAVVLLIECGIWAAAYLWLGALDSPTEAYGYSREFLDYIRNTPIKAERGSASARWSKVASFMLPT